MWDILQSPVTPLACLDHRESQGVEDVQMRVFEKSAQFPQAHSSKKLHEVLLVPDNTNMHFSGPSGSPCWHVISYVAPVRDRASPGCETAKYRCVSRRLNRILHLQSRTYNSREGLGKGRTLSSISASASPTTVLRPQETWPLSRLLPAQLRLSSFSTILFLTKGDQQPGRNDF